jgi:hypothetical protein
MASRTKAGYSIASRWNTNKYNGTCEAILCAKTHQRKIEAETEETESKGRD